MMQKTFDDVLQETHENKNRLQAVMIIGIYRDYSTKMVTGLHREELGFTLDELGHNVQKNLWIGALEKAKAEILRLGDRPMC